MDIDLHIIDAGGSLHHIKDLILDVSRYLNNIAAISDIYDNVNNDLAVNKANLYEGYGGV